MGPPTAWPYLPQTSRSPRRPKPTSCAVLNRSSWLSIARRTERMPRRNVGPIRNGSRRRSYLQKCKSRTKGNRFKVTHRLYHLQPQNPAKSILRRNPSEHPKSREGPPSCYVSSHHSRRDAQWAMLRSRGAGCQAPFPGYARTSSIESTTNDRDRSRLQSRIRNEAATRRCERGTMCAKCTSAFWRYAPQRLGHLNPRPI